jgi:uncharacterized protein with GYD domain
VTWKPNPRRSRIASRRNAGAFAERSYSTLGRYDVVETAEAGDPEEVQTAALILRSLRSEHTEALQATALKTSTSPLKTAL